MFRQVTFVAALHWETFLALITPIFVIPGVLLEMLLQTMFQLVAFFTPRTLVFPSQSVERVEHIAFALIFRTSLA